ISCGVKFRFIARPEIFYSFPLGFLLFKDFCLNEINEAVPQVKFYEEIKEYEKLENEEDRLCRSRQIYDTYVMKELLSCSHNCGFMRPSLFPKADSKIVKIEL
ncbi:hypothetical protein MC885_000135, partial [Smutsia gigantea]